ncbi:lymphocyte antigen 6 complex locus protein G6d [Choloepus didactylus]|uniref:lymphocyte antigen 6 complex locus protein G6d n=1 Tax=Choloepus didactylus TaxID=27675 RepID=UPI0018A02FB9|nr:lymphocyte antigen 6 complex locus protein G6d [Choloepus didactylus]
MRYRCRGPSSCCKETVTTRGNGKCSSFLDRRPHSDPGKIKLAGNPSGTLVHRHPACVAAHHCNQVETELVGDVPDTTHRNCFLGDLCNRAVASSGAPAAVLTAAAPALAWLLPGLWRGWWGQE